MKTATTLRTFFKDGTIDSPVKQGYKELAHKTFYSSKIKHGPA